jgi:hypothetical protein
MRIDLQRTGGVAGIRLASSTASDTLPQPAARELTRLVEASNFFALPARIDAEGAAGDRFTYTITIDDGSRSHTVQVSDAAAPAALRPLIGWLMQATRRRDPPR